MRRFVLTLLALTAAPLAPAQSDLVGRVVESVTCAAEPGQRYALYVPSGYTHDRPWPAIFCFDASARGGMPVERLEAAAERHGYIIAGSLNSRNGPWTENAAAARAMIQDVSARFRLDPRRIYTAGVSGGARVATAIALSGVARGVIGCAGGFPSPDEIPAKVTFPFFGTTGTEDFNHRELVRLDEALESRRTPHRIVVFPGGHEWASVELMMEAVEWLELQAMRSGARPRNEDFIHAALARRQSRVPAEPGPERWRALKSLAADFESLADIGEFQKAAAELAASAGVQAGLKVERAMAARETEWLAQLGTAMSASAGKRRKWVAELREMSGTPTDNAERQMARRVIASFHSMTTETVRGLIEDGDYGPAEALLEMATELQPERPRAWFDLARVRAHRGAKPASLAALQRAAAAGYSGVARLESDPAFNRLRETPAFKEILATVRAQTPAPAAARAATSGPVVVLPAMKVSAALAHVEARLVYLPNARSDLASAGPQVLSHLRVESVRPGTPAERAGLQPFMEITSVQGSRLRGLREDDLHAIMTRPAGRGIVLTVRDAPGGREHDLRIPVP